MKRRWFIAALAAAIATTLVIEVAGNAQPSGKTIVLVKRFSDYKIQFLDRAPKSPTGQPDHITPGDVILQTVALRNAAGRMVGTEYSQLTFFTPSANESSIALEQTTFVLGDGKLVVETVTGPKTGEGDAIVGGTGAYAGVHGTVTDQVLNAKKELRLTLRLTP